MSIAQNERLKLFATALNNAAVGSIITGLFVPLTTFLYNPAHPVPGWWWAIALAWLSMAVSLHLCAQFALGKLVDT